MKKFKKFIVAILIVGFTLELGLLIGDGFTYNKYKYASLNLNGKIVCEVDNLINFSGMASH